MPLVSCPDCGHQVADIAPACPRCGRPHPGQPDAVAGTMMPPPAAPAVPNYLAQSILLTLCCCFSPLTLIPGIVAIVFATKVNDRLRVGDYEGAVAASRNAKMWCWIALGLGVVGFIAATVFFGIVGQAANRAALKT